MSDVRLSDILCYVGGHGYSRYGTATRRVNRISRGGEEFQETISRASVGRYTGSDGGVYPAASGIGRITWKDYDGDGVRESPTILVEPGATNSLLQSQAFGTTWSASNVTNTSAVDTAPDGTTTASSIIPTATNTNLHFAGQAVTITSGEYLAASIYVKATGYSGVVFRVANAVSTQTIQMVVDLASGTILSSVAGGTGATLHGAKLTALANGWYRCGLWGIIAGGVTSAETFVFCYDTGAHAQSQTAFAGDTTSGLLVWGAQLERNGTAAAYPPTTYIPTTTATASRATESWTVPITFDLQQLTVYLKIARPLAADSTGTPGTNQTVGLFSLGNGSSSSLHGYLAIASRTFGLMFNSDAGVTNLGWTAAIPSGTSLDMIVQLKPGAAASVQADFGSGLTGFTGGSFPFTTFANPVIAIGSSASATVPAGSVGTDRLIVAAGLHTLAEMRAIL